MKVLVKSVKDECCKLGFSFLYDYFQMMANGYGMHSNWDNAREMEEIFIAETLYSGVSRVGLGGGFQKSQM